MQAGFLPGKAYSNFTRITLDYYPRFAHWKIAHVFGHKFIVDLQTVIS